MKRSRWVVAGAGAAVAAASTVAIRRPKRQTAFPPGPDALRPEDAPSRARALVEADSVPRRALAMDFAPAISTSVEPLLHGRRYFPRILEDIAAARQHVHLLIYGYKPGDIGTTFRDALAAKVAEGVEVRLQVDAIGSELDFGSKALFHDLVGAGVQVVAHDGVFVVRQGPVGARTAACELEDSLHFDHRKMVIVDGTVAYVGGSGIEDHYNDERFYDVMCRVTGPVVAQLAGGVRGELAQRGRHAPDDASRSSGWFPRPTLVVPDDAAPADRDDRPVERAWHRPPPDQRRDRIVHRGGHRPDRHRQPVHQQPGDPGPAARGGAAWCPGPTDRARASRPRPTRPRRSATTTRA